MSKLNFLFAIALLCGTCTLVGCGGSSEVTVVPEDTTMDAAAEAAYEEELNAASNDQDQN